MCIGDTKAKLSGHKRRVELSEDQWTCDKPACRQKVESPTFGECVVLFFLDGGKIRTLLVFGKLLRTCEALRIWSQHHGIEQFWRYLKSNLHISAMGFLQSRQGAYISLGIKVISYLMLLQSGISIVPLSTIGSASVVSGSSAPVWSGECSTGLDLRSSIFWVDSSVDAHFSLAIRISR